MRYYVNNVLVTRQQLLVIAMQHFGSDTTHAEERVERWEDYANEYNIFEMANLWVWDESDSIIGDRFTVKIFKN